jgi:hypothetical protein
MEWLAPDSAPTDERAFLIQLDESPDVVELVSVARFNKRDGVFLDIMNRIILTPDDSRLIGWQPLPNRGATLARQILPVSRSGHIAALAALVAASFAGGVSYVRNPSVIDAVFTTAAVFAVLVVIGLAYQRLRYGAFSI